MPPLISTPLPKIAFSKNTIALKITTADYLQDQPATSINYIQFPGAIAPDTVLAISWTGGVATMTAKAVPNDTGMQFPSGDGSSVYIESLIPWFQGNFFLDSFYTITFENSGAYPRLIFTAKTQSASFDFSPLSNIGVMQQGKSANPKANFRHHIEVWLERATGGSYDQVYSANVPLDNAVTGISTNDIHDALHSYLSSDKPDLVNKVARCTNSIRRYFIKFADMYGSSPVIMRVYNSELNFVALGGLSKQAAAVRDITSELCPIPLDRSTWKALRVGSKNKLVRIDQPEWITWINMGVGTLAVQLEVTITNQDGTTFTFFSSDNAYGATGYSKYQFQAGYTQLGVAGRQGAGKRPVYYTARIKSGANYLSAPYAFVIDYNYEENPRYFVYQNAYGAYQTICTTGKGQAEFDRSKDDAQLAVNQRTAAISGEFLETNIVFQDKATVSYGYSRAGKRNVALLRDFFASDSKFIYEKGQLIPIGINTKNVKDAGDGVDPYSTSFEYYPLYAEDQYTEDLSVVDELINELLADAGSAPLTLPPADGDELTGSYILVEFLDPHLSIVTGRQRYTAATWLAGRTNYVIYSTQLGAYFRQEDIAYNVAGYFDILLPGFTLQAGDQLIIWPFKLNPDN